MFVRAIEVASNFTRAIHIVTRNYRSTLAQPGAATLFLVNDEGWALTCSHVSAVIAGTGELAERRKQFQAEHAAQKSKQAKRACEAKYNLDNKKTYEILTNIVGCVDTSSGIEIRAHPTLDIALLRFMDFEKLNCNRFPVFAKDGDEIKQGKSLCRLGFPFAEFTNFHYDAHSDSIAWTSSGTAVTPQFPLEGMVTRHVADANQEIVGFEMSTPGLRGQSGGPAFDFNGVIWGMQSSTNHLDLDFDVNMDVVRDGAKKRVHDSAFLHVGRCVHVNAMKKFMRDNKVTFHES